MLNPEPCSEEGGVSVKWVVPAPINQAQQGRVVDARAGTREASGRVCPEAVPGTAMRACGDAANARSSASRSASGNVDESR